MLSLESLPLCLAFDFTQRDQFEPPIHILLHRVFSLPLDLLCHRVILHKSEHRPQATPHFLESVTTHFLRHLV
jgi:hypothetical protein